MKVLIKTQQEAEALANSGLIRCEVGVDQLKRGVSMPTAVDVDFMNKMDDARKGDTGLDTLAMALGCLAGGEGPFQLASDADTTVEAALLSAVESTVERSEKMRNPTSKQLKKVIANFDKVLTSNAYASEVGALDMMESEVDLESNACGTPMCHGGWYLHATLPHLSEAKKQEAYDAACGILDYDAGAHIMATDLGFSDEYELKAYDAACGILDYDAGAHIMATDLGFSDEYELREWASNREVWGNRFGAGLFSCNSAFQKNPHSPEDLGAETLVDIRNHWARLHNRLYKNYRADIVPEVKVQAVQEVTERLTLVPIGQPAPSFTTHRVLLRSPNDMDKLISLGLITDKYLVTRSHQFCYPTRINISDPADCNFYSGDSIMTVDQAIELANDK